MFCTHCGAGQQSTGAYCKRCGKWLGSSAPEQRMIIMMVFSAISAVFGGASAIALFSTYLGTTAGTPAVYLAATFCTIISVYQIINLIFTLGLFQRRKESREENQASRTRGEAEQYELSEQSRPALGPARDGAFIDTPSITESTTDLLEPVRRVTRKDPNR